MMNIYAVIDGDNINGRVAENLFITLDSLGCVKEIYVVTKDAGVKEYYKTIIKDRYKNAKILFESADSQTNSCDIICGFYLGNLSYKLQERNDTQIAIISNDKLIISLGRLVLRNKLKVIILESTFGELLYKDNKSVQVINVNADGNDNSEFSKTKENSPKANTDSRKDIPVWLNKNLTARDKLIGLRVLAVPTIEHTEMPTFIPFPMDRGSISIGCHADISLGAWDVENGLYNNHVVIEYHPLPCSTWSIRSLRGMRRRNKATIINRAL